MKLHFCLGTLDPYILFLWLLLVYLNSFSRTFQSVQLKSQVLKTSISTQKTIKTLNLYKCETLPIKIHY